MNRKEATTLLGKVINEGELPDLAAIYVAHQNLKRVEKVVGLVKDSMGQARMHRNDIWLHSIKRILTLLTEEE